MESQAWVRPVAEELMVDPEKVQALAAAALLVGMPLTPADLIATGARVARDGLRTAVSTVPAQAGTAPRGAAAPQRLRWERRLPWR
jgi:hypothetical protein